MRFDELIWSPFISSSYSINFFVVFNDTLSEFYHVFLTLTSDCVTERIDFALTLVNAPSSKDSLFL